MGWLQNIHIPTNLVGTGSEYGFFYRVMDPYLVLIDFDNLLETNLICKSKFIEVWRIA